jgi:hypothetical protein
LELLWTRSRPPKVKGVLFSVGLRDLEMMQRSREKTSIVSLANLVMRAEERMDLGSQLFHPELNREQRMIGDGSGVVALPRGLGFEHSCSQSTCRQPAH